MFATFDQIKMNKDWLAIKLTSKLRDRFNRGGLLAGCGIGKNKDGALDLAVEILDLRQPDECVGTDVLDYAEKKVREWVPESKASVIPVKTAIAGGVDFD